MMGGNFMNEHFRNQERLKGEKPKPEFEIPTHDPQTGELNPYYEELTGKINPLKEGRKTNL